MPKITQKFTYINGQIADASKLNQDIAQLVSTVNALDGTNIVNSSLGKNHLNFFVSSNWLDYADNEATITSAPADPTKAGSVIVALAEKSLWLYSTLGIPQKIAGALPAMTHNELTSRDAADSHPISAITNLQTTIDGINTSISTKEKGITKASSGPASPVLNDLWLDTSVFPHKLKKWDGGSWILCTPVVASDINAEKAMTKSTVQPSNAAVNDLWLDTSVVPNRLKKYDGAQWLNCSATTYTDVGAQKPITIASVAPSSPVANDLWLDTSALPYVLKRWSGVAWGSASIYAASQVPISDAGNIITATNVETALQELAAYKKPSGFEVTMSLDQTVATSSTSVKANFDTVAYDNKSEWDATNKVFVSAAGGVYSVNVGMLVSSTAAGSIRYEIIKVAVGGAETSYGIMINWHGGQAFFLQHAQKHIKLAAGEKMYVKFRYEGGTGNATISKDPTYTQFSAIRVSD